mgnify:CR=1 FL=1
MSSQCAREEDLVRLLDGELTENDAERLRRHLGACDLCKARSEDLKRTLRDLKAPLPDTDVDVELAIENVMHGLPTAVAENGIARLRPRTSFRRLATIGLAATLAMGAFVFVVRLAAPREDPQAFLARGTSADMSVARAVGVAIYRESDSRETLAQGSPVRVSDAYGVRYRNILTEPTYLLAFAVDATGTIHWLSPAYLDPRSDPVAIALSPSKMEIPLATAVQFDAPAPGPMRFVVILTSSPMHVHDVETLHGDPLTTASLRARWPSADIRELVTVHVDSSR